MGFPDDTVSGNISSEHLLQSVLASFGTAEIRLTRRFWLPLFSLFLVCLCVSMAASQAHATCGDYLSHHGLSHHDEVAFGHSNMPGGTEPANETPRRKPCNGPSCHRAPLQSPAPVPVVTFPAQDRWVLLATGDLNRGDQKCFLVQIDEPVALPMIAFRLDRPPKAC